MADWKVPSTKGYVPGGRFLRGIGRGIRDLSAQAIAIRQWEAEKEEKRQRQEFEKMKFESQKQYQEQQLALGQRRLDITEAHNQVMENYTKLQGDLLTARIAEIYSKLQEQNIEPPKGLEKTLGIGLQVKSALGNKLVSAINQAQAYGFVSRDWTAFDELEDKLRDPALLTAEGSRVDAFGFPITTIDMTSDMARIGTMYYQIGAMSNQYRDKPKEFKKIEPLRAEPVKPRDDEKYRKDRATAFRLMLEGKDAEAEKLMEPHQMTLKEKQDLMVKVLKAQQGR